MKWPIRAKKLKVETPVDTVAVAMAKNGNKTEDIWMAEFQRIAGPDATISEKAQGSLHTLRMYRYVVSADSA